MGSHASWQPPVFTSPCATKPIWCRRPSDATPCPCSMSTFTWLKATLGAPNPATCPICVSSSGHGGGTNPRGHYSPIYPGWPLPALHTSQSPPRGVSREPSKGSLGNTGRRVRGGLSYGSHPVWKMKPLTVVTCCWDWVSKEFCHTACSTTPCGSQVLEWLGTSPHVPSLPHQCSSHSAYGTTCWERQVLDSWELPKTVLLPSFLSCLLLEKAGLL